MKVREYTVRVVLNSKARPTLEVCVNGFCASPPSGTSKSTKEVRPWPEGGSELDRVRRAMEHARGILRELEGKEVYPQEVERDLLPERETFGGNTVLAIVIPLYKAEAAEREEPLWKYLSEVLRTSPAFPRPLENVVGGGEHGGGTDVQEFLLFPRDRSDVKEAIFVLSEAYQRIKEELSRRDPSFSSCLTLESAWVTSLRTEEILDVLSDIGNEMGLGLGMDVAASTLYDGNAYVWKREGIVRDREAQIEYMVELAERYGLSYLEDPLEENDVDGFLEIQRRLKGTVVVGDDLFATRKDLLVNGIGGLIVKYNQRGSVLESAEAAERARELGMKVVVSHRSGETEDTFLSHLAVALGADLIKAGAAGIRVVKLNELLRIWDQRSLALLP